MQTCHIEIPQLVTRKGDASQKTSFDESNTKFTLGLGSYKYVFVFAQPLQLGPVRVFLGAGCFTRYLAGCLAGIIVRIARRRAGKIATPVVIPDAIPLDRPPALEIHWGDVSV